MKYINAIINEDQEAFKDEVILSIGEKILNIADKIKENVLSSMYEEHILASDYDEFISMLEENDIDYSIDGEYIVIEDDALNESIDEFLLEKSKRKFSKKRVKYNVAGAGKRGNTVKRKLKVICPSGKTRVRGKNTCTTQSSKQKRSVRKREKSKKRGRSKGLFKRNQKIGNVKRKKTKR